MSLVRELFGLKINSKEKMIDYIHRTSTMTLECDICGEEAEFNGDWKYCIIEAKENGWIIIKKKGVFHHYCYENCKGES